MNEPDTTGRRGGPRTLSCGSEVALVRAHSCRGTARGSTWESCARSLRPLAGPWQRARGAAGGPTGGRRARLFEPGVWITAPGAPACGSATGTFLNLGVMVASLELVEIGDHCMLANGCYVTDSSTGSTTPTDRAVAGLHQQGPDRIGDNVWCGVNVVVTSGVTVGERCVIGANSVVTSDIPPFSVAAGVPARVLRPITY